MWPDVQNEQENDMSRKQYAVKTVVDHDNKRYEIGSTIDLDDEQAESLLALKAIEGPTGDAELQVPTDAKERLAAIVTAIGKIDLNNTDLWLKDGKPASEAIAAVLGWSVTAAERNAAWAIINPDA
jgi:hypothetical protein